MKSIH